MASAKITCRVWMILALLFLARPIFAQWLLPGQADFSKAATRVLPVRDNLSLIEMQTPQSVFHTLVLTGPDGFLLVDHPEAAANPAIQKEFG